MLFEVIHPFRMYQFRYGLGQEPLLGWVMCGRIRALADGASKQVSK